MTINNIKILKGLTQAAHLLRQHEPSLFDAFVVKFSTYLSADLVNSLDEATSLNDISALLLGKFDYIGHKLRIIR